jgi:hypothetical protein
LSASPKEEDRVTTLLAQAREERARRIQDPDAAVMTFREWYEANSISRATAQRIKAAGEGPRFIQLSPRRIGVTVGENRRWQKERAK